jgi:hypothetical protein
MSEEKWTVSSREFLMKEANSASEFLVGANGADLFVDRGEEVMKGETVEERDGDTVIFRWTLITATTDGAKKGFVRSESVIPLTDNLGGVGGHTTFPLEISRLDFAESCVQNAIFAQTNAAFLYMCAWIESGESWTGDTVKAPPAANGAAGIYQFTPETWNLLIIESQMAGIASDHLPFPGVQCIVASWLASLATKAIREKMKGRRASALDLYIAFLLADAPLGSSGSKYSPQGAISVLEKIPSAPDTLIQPLLAAAYSGQGQRLDRLMARKGDLFGGVGSLTVGGFAERCRAPLKEAIEEVRRFAGKLISDIPTTGDSNVVTGAFDGRILEIGENDADAMIRVAHAEASVFQEDEARKAVIDTIINRTVHDRHNRFPDTIAGVINQPHQFQPVAEHGNDWTNLPQAPQATRQMLLGHLRNRASGAPSVIAGALYFLNPHFSDANAFNPNPPPQKWGNEVVENPVKKYGGGNTVHYHGNPGASVPPGTYAIRFGNDTAYFLGDGTRFEPELRAAGSMMDIIVQTARGEWELFGNGSLKETDDAVFRRVGDYWKIVGENFNGRTELTKSNGKKFRPAWSSAFISYVIAKSGGRDRFKYSQAHCHYVQDFVRGRVNGLFAAERPDTYAPKVGDIVHYGRESAKQFNFDDAKMAYDADQKYSSHSDIVVAVDRDAKTVSTIGGNVSDSVKQKTFVTDAHGRLKKRVDNGREYPWISVLRLLG